MNSSSDDEIYRGYKLSIVQSGAEWLVTIWPTEVNQTMPDPCEPPPQAADREAALTDARSRVDDLKL